MASSVCIVWRHSRTETPVPSSTPQCFGSDLRTPYGPAGKSGISRPDTCLHPTHARLLVLQRFHLCRRGRPHRRFMFHRAEKVEGLAAAPLQGEATLRRRHDTTHNADRSTSRNQPGGAASFGSRFCERRGERFHSRSLRSLAGMLTSRSGGHAGVRCRDGR